MCNFKILSVGLIAGFVSATGLFAQPQATNSASGAEIRVLDKVTGIVTDVSLGNGQGERIGQVLITLADCRFPASNPTGDAFAQLTVSYGNVVDPIFLGWMIASAPALNALDHPRYDVWVLRCVNS